MPPFLEASTGHEDISGGNETHFQAGGVVHFLEVPWEAQSVETMDRGTT